MGGVGTTAGAAPTGTAVLVMALLVTVTSSSLALTMAYLFRSGYPYQSTVLAAQQLVCTGFGVVAMQSQAGAENSMGGLAQANADNIPILVLPGGNTLDICVIPDTSSTPWWGSLFR